MINISSRRLTQWMSRFFVLALLVGLFQMTVLANFSLANPLSTLRLGSEGDAVGQLQTQLQTLGYFDTEINGIYNESTQVAVQAFQRDHNMRADGIAGAETQQQLASH